MPPFTFTAYFEYNVLRRSPYVRKEWCILTVTDPVREEKQRDGRCRFWRPIPELSGRVLRVITLPDRTTIHNAFLDRRFKT
jgi:hypothetical protein